MSNSSDNVDDVAPAGAAGVSDGGDRERENINDSSTLPTALERLHRSLLEKFNKIDELSALHACQQEKLDVMKGQLTSGLELAEEQLELARLKFTSEELVASAAEQTKRQQDITKAM